MIKPITEKDGQVITTHSLKTWPEFYQLLEDGLKTFELRKDDRGFNPGDILLLHEYDPITESYTERVSRWEILSILYPSFGLKEGYVILSLRRKHDTFMEWAVEHFVLLFLLLVIFIQSLIILIN